MGCRSYLREFTGVIKDGLHELLKIVNKSYYRWFTGVIKDSLQKLLKIF